MRDDFPQGAVHRASADLEAAVRADPALLDLWAGLTPLGRNEFICWIEVAKQEATRQRRIVRLTEELHEGQRRPCCWPGCPHRPRQAAEPVAEGDRGKERR